MFSLERTATIASLRCRLAGYGVPSGKLSAKRETPPRSYFGIHRRIFSGESLFTTSSPPHAKDLTGHEKRLSLREIKRDIAYFNRSFRRADLSVDISGSSLDDASRRVWDVFEPTQLVERSNAWNIALL